MGSFDAGSIEGRLDLDTSPFQRGLDEARADADRFEAEPIRKRVVLDDSEAKAKMDAFDAEEGSRDINQKVDVDTRPASRKMDEFRAEQKVKNAAASGGGGGGGFGALGGVGLLGAAIGAGIGVLPGLSPMISGAGMTAIAGSSMFGQFMGATMLMKTMTTEAIKAAQQAQQITSRPLPKNATALQRKNYQEAFDTMKISHEMLTNITALGNTWQNLYQNPAVYSMINQGAETLNGFLPKLSPLISSVAHGFIPVINELGKSLNGAGFSKFQGMLQSNYKNLIPVWGDSIIKTLGGIGGIMEATNPEMKSFSHELDGLMNKFNNWGQNGGAKKFFDSWNAYDAQFKPQMHQLGGDTLGGLSHLLGPQGLGNPALVHGSLSMLDGIFSTLRHADLAPLRNALSGIQAAEKNLGPGISTALPGILTLIGSIGNLSSHVNWKVVGTSIDLTATAVSKLADGVAALDDHTGGMLGTLAGFGIVGLAGKKLLGGPLAKLTGGGGSSNSVLGEAEKALGLKAGSGTAVYVTNWPHSFGGGGGNPIVNDAKTVAKDGAEGAAGWTLWSGLKGVGTQFMNDAKYGQNASWMSGIKGLPASISALGSGSKLASILGRVGNVVDHLSPEGIAFLLAGSGGGSGLGSNVKTDKFGGLYSPSVAQSGSNKFWSFLPGEQSDGRPATPRYYFPKGSHLTADSTVMGGNSGLNYDNGSARVSGTSNYALMQMLGSTGLLSGIKQNKGFLQYSGTEAALESAIKMLGEISHVNKHGMLASPGKNFGVVPKASWQDMYSQLGIDTKHPVKAAPWDAIVKYLAKTAEAVGSPKGIAGIIDVKKWERDLGAGFTSALKAQMNPTKPPAWAASWLGIGAKPATVKPAAGAIDPGVAKLLNPTLKMVTGQSQTNKSLADVHAAIAAAQSASHNDSATVNGSLSTLIGAVKNLGPEIAGSVKSANASSTQQIITAVRAGKKP